MVRLPVIVAIVFALGLSLLALGAGAQTPQPGKGSSRAPWAQDPVLDPADSPLPVFEFHSGFWINLHHFLYQQARGEVQRDASSAEMRDDSAWQAALEFYRRDLAGRDLLFSSAMVNIKNRLAELGSAPDLSQSGLQPELVRALETAAALYREKIWPQHDQANRAWVAAATPLVRQFGRQLATGLAVVYRTPWPEGRIRVDVTIHAGRVGGYTSLDPLHITISSADPRNQGQDALELLFHEASHGLARPVADGIAKRCRDLNKPIPRDLWHAILFYTTGEIVRRSLVQSSEAASKENYLPYAFRHRLYQRGWENYLRLIEQHWKPYLDGQIGFEQALTRLVNAL